MSPIANDLAKNSFRHVGTPKGVGELPPPPLDSHQPMRYSIARLSELKATFSTGLDNAWVVTV